MQFNQNEILNIATQMADLARSAIKPYFRGNHGVINKGEIEYDPVTLADKAAEEIMRNHLLKIRPDDAIHGEEFGISSGTSGIEWVIDPIDGTRAFVAGTSTWGVLIAAYFNGAPIIGLMDQPFTGERWIGAPNIAQWQRHDEIKPLKCNPNVTLNDAVIATTDPFLFHGKERDGFEILRKTAPITRYGLDCTAYGLLALGGIGLVVENGLKKVDLGALIPIVENAGGIFTDWQGNKNPEGGQVIAAANPKIHEEAMKALAAAAD